MCGRFAFVPNFKEITEEFGSLEFKQKPWSSYNIAPTQSVGVIANEGKEVFDAYTWGFIYHFGKDAFKSIINTRLEGLFDKPVFRKAFTDRRIIVPASGYFEWQEVKGKKVPHYIKPNKGYLGFAGIYQEKEDGRRFSIITTNATEKLNPIHDRMPVIIKKKNYSEWLNKEIPLEDLQSIANDSRIDLGTTIISTNVNNVKNNSPENLKPVQGTLF